MVFSFEKTEKSLYLSVAMKKLYLFNPENDMALASGSPYYMPPASAKKMAVDLAMLPVWYAEKGSDVLLADSRQVEWLHKECTLSLMVEGRTEMPSEDVELMPWGWSPALLHRFGEISWWGDMNIVRRLSSRKTALDLLPELRVIDTVGESFWLTSIEDVCGFAEKYDKVLLKSPWSGSGKGIQTLCGCPDDNQKGWIRRIIASQGGVVGEPFYHKVKDFAMEFEMSKEGVVFVGYSLFETDMRGIYKENLLVSNKNAETILSEFVPKKTLEELCVLLQHGLQNLLGNDYQGYLGVDMMVVQSEKGYAIHPCVEVNLRMNMGIVSRLFFDRYVCSDVIGRYLIEYFPNDGEALRFHEDMKRKYPLRFREGRIKEGYLSLTPVFSDTNYQIYVVL